MICKSLLAIMAGLVIALHSPALSAGKDYRRLAVELALIRGDSRILLQKPLSEVKRRWIENRLTGSLNQLELIGRYYLTSTDEADAGLLQQIRSLQQSKHDLELLHTAATILSKRYPVKFAYDLDTVLSPALKKKVKKNYQKLCYSCHAGAAVEKSVISGNLTVFAQEMSSDEWLARLLGGLHGDVFTLYENPFSDSMILLFHAYIKKLND